MKRILLSILVIGVLLFSTCGILTETYSLSVSISPPRAGSVSPSGGQYQSGTEVTLTATSASGYTFNFWNGDASGSSPTITITMDSDKSVIAHFKCITYSLSVSVDPSGAGSVTLTPPGGNYPSGTVVTLKAVPAPGYSFDHWSGDASGTSLTTTITMESDKSVGAHFTATASTEWMTPISAVASGYTVWGGTWYTGPPSLSIDGNRITAWTLNNMGEITFDLGSERLVAGIEAYWGGHVTNGNTVNVYVDGVQVLSNEQFGATSNIRYFTPVRGRFIKYQTVALPHNEYLQIATWSEIAEFRVLVEVK